MHPPSAGERGLHRRPHLGVDRREAQHLHLIGCRRAVAGGGLELGQGPLDRVARAGVDGLAQGAQRHDQGQGLAHGQPQRPPQVVGVVEPHDAIDLQRLHVDVDHVAGDGLGQAAEPQHVQVVDDGLPVDAEVAGDLLDGYTALVLQVRHQGQHPPHLVAGTVAHGAASAPRQASRRNRATTAAASSGGSTATTSAP